MTAPQIQRPAKRETPDKVLFALDCFAALKLKNDRQYGIDPDAVRGMIVQLDGAEHTRRSVSPNAFNSVEDSALTVSKIIEPMGLWAEWVVLRHHPRERSTWSFFGADPGSSEEGRQLLKEIGDARAKLFDWLKMDERSVRRGFMRRTDEWLDALYAEVCFQVRVRICK